MIWRTSSVPHQGADDGQRSNEGGRARALALRLAESLATGLAIGVGFAIVHAIAG